MKKSIVFSFIFLMNLSLLFGQSQIQIINNSAEKKVDVLIDQQLFTSYIYPDNIKKPVLWPVITSGGNEITRQFPLKTKAGERADHPHHIGIWLNYGDVNGLDFWNNSEAIPIENANNYGTIYQGEIIKTESGTGKGTIQTTAFWENSKGEKLLDESTEFTFSVQGKTRIIDRKTTLKATSGKVNITDNKEGMFAIRVTRELELPSTGKVELVDSHGNTTTVEASDDNIANGNYLSSNGIKGDAVWGTRAKWMELSGVVNGENVAIVIFDYPENPGYPTYWHARGYGLFAANTLGQKVFSNGKEEMNFSIEKGDSATFFYRLAIFSGYLSVDEINKMAIEFELKN